MVVIPKPPPTPNTFVQSSYRINPLLKNEAFTVENQVFQETRIGNKRVVGAGECFVAHGIKPDAVGQAQATKRHAPTELFGSQRQHHPSVRLRAVGQDSFPESFPNCLEVAALCYQYQSHPLSGGLKSNHQPVADLDNPQK